MRVAHLDERRTRRLLDVMRLDFYRAKLIGTATIGAFHSPLEWACARDEASHFSAGEPPLRIASARKCWSGCCDNELYVVAHHINVAPIR
jgi:hypothetical protein